MIDINQIINNRNTFEEKMLKRGWRSCPLESYSNTPLLEENGALKGNISLPVSEVGVFCIDYLLLLNEAKKSTLQKLEALRQEVNTLSDEIAVAKRSGHNLNFTEAQKKSGLIGTQISEAEENLRHTSNLLQKELSRIPNIVDERVPNGRDEEDNIQISSYGAKRDFRFTPREHQDICSQIGGLSLLAGPKVASTRTNFMFGDIAKLHRAIASFMVDMHVKEHGFTEVSFPVLVRPNCLFKTGQLSNFNFSEDLFHIADTLPANEDLEDVPSIKGLNMNKDLFLIPTGEVPMVNVVGNSLIEEEDLPIRLVGYSECFRKEAGAGGKDIKGIIRQKQFGKVELVVICKPEDSEEEHQKILSSAENILRALELHYRVVLLCTGDIGFASRLTYDIEVWLPGQQRYREISSCSNTGDFQTRRANIRFRSGKKKGYAHALNGSGLAVGRTLVAIIENYQNEDGTITVPEVLRQYMNGTELITNQNTMNLLRYMSID